MNILIIIPITGLSNDDIQKRMTYLQSIVRNDTEIVYIQLTDGPLAIECLVDHLQAAAEVIKVVPNLEERGFDAIIVWCGGDPGVEEARTLVDIPIIGPGESMRLFASFMGRKVACIPHPLPVLELRDDLDKTYILTEEKIRDAVNEGYDSFYLDCLGMYGMGKKLREKTGYSIIDGGEASLKLAEVIVELGLKTNRLAYPKYPPPHRL
jgi:allantoin racemase